MKKILALLIYFILPVSAYPESLIPDHPEDQQQPDVSPQFILDNYNRAMCCQFIDQLEAVKLERRNRIELNLYDSGKLLELSTGPTFAALVEIPVSEKEEKYLIETRVIEVGEDMYVYFPYIATLDRNLKLIGTSAFTRNDYYGKSFFQSIGYMNFSFFVDPNTDGEKAVRYLLIYTRKKHFTTQSMAELKTASRNVVLKEVAVEYAYSLGENIHRDILYGLPGGRVIVTNKGKFF